MKKLLEKLALYEKENRAFTLVAYGDSVTDGCFLPGEKDFDAVWHAQFARLLQAMFPQLRINRINAGIGGISTVASVDRLRADALDYKPDLAVVCLGLNDIAGSADGFFAALRSILTGLKASGTEVIYLAPNMVCTAPDHGRIAQMFGNTGTADYAVTLAGLQNNGHVDEIFGRAKEIARECGAVACDGYGAWKALAEAGKDVDPLLENRINHPTRGMHGVFAALLLQSLLFDEAD